MDKKQWEQLFEQAEERAAADFKVIEKIERANQRKVLDAFRSVGIREDHLYASTGYGYNDMGREAIEAVYAKVFGTGDALVRLQLISGTHALAKTLFGLLRPGDCIISGAGAPYDTMHKVIGIEDQPGSLKDWGVQYKEVPLNEEERLDIPALKKAVEETDNLKVVLLQRSRGYSFRPSLTLEEIKAASQAVKAIRPETIIMVDNCYGEFTEMMEPTECGADVVCGSLMKNPGGGIARTGGYMAGPEHLVDAVANAAFAPGLGKEAGPTLNQNGLFLQGLFLAPHTTAEAMKSAAYLAACLEILGFDTSPKVGETRHDIIQAVRFFDEKKLISFVQSIQAASPVDAHVTPIPWDMPGYTDPVIMAAGTFVQGSSIELTCDAPIRPPYTAYLQGALTYGHGRIATEEALMKMME